MPMKQAATAADLCTRQVVVCPPSLSVDEAARLFPPLPTTPVITLGSDDETADV